MAVRFYPDVDDAATLEKLAGVPEGSAALAAHADVLRKSLEANGEHAAEFEFHSWVRHYLPYAAEYSDFKTFGWGRCTQAQNLVVEAGHDADCGRIDDPALVEQVLTALQVPPHLWSLIPAVCWG